jgi:pimeloyl-ACP methyl ester carboxylesterase
MSPAEPEPAFFHAADSTRLAYYEMGEGPVVVLIHGLFSNAWTNWIRYGHAGRIVAAGFRLVMPDLRGHGRSGAPHDPAYWGPDILAQDGEALVAHLGLTDYVLGGYSLGGRTTVRMLVRGATPRAAIVSGMGLEGLLHTYGRGAFFRTVLEGFGTHRRGSPEWMAEAFLKTTGGDPQALLPLLDSFVDSSADQFESMNLPLLVVTGREDQDNGSAAALADILPQGRFAEIPGNHMSAVLKPELATEMIAFLASLPGV